MIIPTDRPVYRILDVQGFFGPDDHLYREGDVIIFDDCPNEEMEPLNDLAREKFEAYVKSLDESAREVAAKNGRHYAGRARSMEDRIALASQDARKVQLISGDGGVPLMKGRKPGKPRVQKLEDDEAPETGRRTPLRISEARV